MRKAASTEIRRLERLHEEAELELSWLAARETLTPRDAKRMRDLESQQQQLQARIAWFEAILREHVAPPLEPNPPAIRRARPGA